MDTTIFKGKNEAEILKSFLDKYNIEDDDWDKLIKNCKKEKVKKYFILFWAVSCLCILFSFLITLLCTFTDEKGFPRVFINASSFFETFINIALGILLFSTSISLMAIIINKIQKTFS